ncbi:SGNH/GDSL hydrolase family protein [Kitasatospora sp. NBC_01287]|uniref:SGNH/GDSL hydrolase family protein n=1 Tax=Kitasatospora sp. NBC_01287 TaxID=2903573 RepID=UPI00225387A2|nr:SGNH/GDSL hydrolase family protein [Kitasatospora sp. NBC_01287]MCX4748068.1 SGNH/GDSL hydrolase family protein [Kitasatospora sp. NBC_01287]
MLIEASSRTEETDPFCLPSPRAAELLARAPWRRFAGIGDSLSAGTGGPSPGYASLGWPDRVADVLRRVHPDLAYLNLAEVGATTAGALATQFDRIAEFAPDLLHLPCGANDLFHARPDFTVIEGKLRQLFALAAGTGAQLTTFTLGRAFVVPGFPDWPDRVRTVNAITREVARDHGALVIDMADHPVNDRPDLLSADGIHFSASGQAVLAAEVVRSLAGLLDTTTPE